MKHAIQPAACIDKVIGELREQKGLLSLLARNESAPGSSLIWKFALLQISASG